jgi:hypothetical protein
VEARKPEEKVAGNVAVAAHGTTMPSWGELQLVANDRHST